MEAVYAVDTSVLPGRPGAYVLDLWLARRCTFDTRLLGRVRLSPGRYLYAGSARGPGGLKARIARHFRTCKPRRWHVDHLTEKAERVAAVAVPDGHECTLAARLRTLEGVAVPVVGFGSSDCNRCPAHLFSWSHDGTAQALVELLGG